MKQVTKIVFPRSAADLNALAPTTDINTFVDIANNQMNLANPEVFYSKQLLDTIRLGQDQYVYYRYAEESPIQDKAGKLTMRRWAPLQAHTTPLVEGVPPKSDRGSVRKYELEAYQYGRYMEFTDKVDFNVVDPTLAIYSAEYAIVAIETLDMLARQTLLTMSQKFYAGLAQNIQAMTIAKGKPSIADLRLIGLSLKKQLVKPRTNGKYHVICSPEFTFDMLDDPYVQKYMEYNQSTSPLYDGEVLCPMFGFEFYEALNCPDSAEFVNADDVECNMIYREAPTGGASVSFNGKTFTAADADEAGYIYAVLPAEVSGTKYLTVADGYVKDSMTGKDASYIPNKRTWTAPDGWKILKVQHTIVLGAEALTRTGLAGEGNAKMYTKGLGSSGVLDPIDQRQSIGFKINSVGFGSTRPEAIYDYVNIPTQLNV